MAVNLGVAGLHTFANELEYPDDAQSEARNVVIDKDGVVESRRGFKQYGDTFGSSNTVAKALLEYKGRIIRHFANTLQFDNGSGTFTSFTGSYTEPESNIRMKFQEARSNLYLTTNTGIKKISASSAANINASSIDDAGGIKAIDVEADMNYSKSGFFTTESKVAYRVVWGYRDANDNLILGTPSPRVEVINRSASNTGIVDLTFTIPDDVTADVHFYQVYRSAVITDAGFTSVDDIEIDDELQLVIEDFPTTAELSAGEVTVTDINPEDFRASGTPLYTNVNSGEGLLQANERPPLSKDLTLFKGSMFYANTKTVHRKEIDLLGITNFNSGSSKFIISDGTTTEEYLFVGTPEVSGIITVDQSSAVSASWFEITSFDGKRTYYVWMNTGSSLDPNPDPTYIGIECDIDAGSASSASDVADQIKAACEANENFANDFTVQKTATSPGNATFTTVDTSADTITSTAHGFYTGLKVQVSTSGTLPTGLTASTDYYLIRTDADTLQFATSLANALAGTQIDLTGTGSGTQTIEVQDDNLVFIHKNNGNAANIADGSTSTAFDIYTAQNGDGEDLTATPDQVRLSGLTTAGQQIDDTARSLSKVINKSSSLVNSYYISSASDLPGQLVIESKTIEDVPMYFAVSSSTISDSFNPQLPANQAGTTNTGTTVTCTVTGHNYSDGDSVIIHNSTTTPSIDGIYTISNSTANTFDITPAAEVTVSGNIEVFAATESSSNEEKPNRLYFSKFQQPEAVPLLNFIDIGSQDEPIERIVALRDSLFVFKTDSIHRVYGAVAPNFSQTIFDSSASIIAPDSAAVLNNQIFILSTQGVVKVSESSTPIVVSRPIEDKLFKLSSDNFSTRTATFAISSESDRAYFLWTVQTTTETQASTCYRYNVFTRAWTEWPIAKNAGIVNSGDDKIYLVPTDINKLEQERKDLTRKDYADREFTISIGSGALNGTNLEVSSTSGIKAGHVLQQTQYVTMSFFNRFLRTLDRDAGLTDTDYESTLALSAGGNLTTAMANLATKLAADDSGYAHTFSGSTDPETIQTELNTIITNLNTGSSDTVKKDYPLSSGTTDIELLITNVAFVGNIVTIVYENPPIFQGNITHFQSIETKTTWIPQHFGDPMSLKQVAEGTFLFRFNNFTSGTISYNSDLEQDFTSVSFTEFGPGQWGGFQFGDHSFGGQGQKKPVRTYIPRTKQRCRFLQCRFEHKNAFEKWECFGLSLEPRVISSRAYR